MEEEPEIMMTKRANPIQDIEPSIREHHKRKKSRRDEGPSTRKHTKRTRRKIGNNDLRLSRGQPEYLIMSDLSKQTTNITIGQLIARCPSLRNELRQGTSIR
jgi:hypothetical protein